MTRKLTVGSLFAGIGGFDLAAERAGMEVKWQVEIDDYATRVLAKHWPDVPRYRDVRECGAHNLPSVDVICGGFPCQDKESDPVQLQIEELRALVGSATAKAASAEQKVASLADQHAATKDDLRRLRAYFGAIANSSKIQQVVSYIRGAK